MKILFVLSEGPHDAQVIGRLLKVSGQYEEYTKPLKDWPKPLDQFIMTKFQTHNIDEIKIAKPKGPLVPACAFIHRESQDFLVLPIPLGGKDQTTIGNNLLTELYKSLSSKVLNISKSQIQGYGVMFIYDADNRGIKQTIELFRQDYNFDQVKKRNKWYLYEHPISLFIFSSKNNKGTLEDLLEIEFIQNSPHKIQASRQYLQTYFSAKSAQEDEIAYQAKKKKALLTVCGQAEKKLAGSALTVVIRDTQILDDAFDLQNANPWKELLDLINDTVNQIQ
ncbi:MAG: hypothetical protein IV090_21470 [Candidatus Sericytochromatia bacterium]|nr:hypothetical protein [Candidatus Sericytochromatia bacterium]